eukprot:s3760_g3.t1
MRASSIAAAQAAASAAAAALRAHGHDGAESARDAPRSAREMLSHRLAERRRCQPMVSWSQGPVFSRENSRQGLYLPLPSRVPEGSDGEDNGEDCWVWLGFGVGLSIWLVADADLAPEENGVQSSQSAGWDVPSSCEDCRLRVKLMLENPASGRAAAFVQYTMFIVIMAAVTCAICETIPEMEHEYIFHILDPGEPVFTAVFTLEISTRWWVADSNWDFFASPFSIIDMLATLPGMLP